MALSEAIVWTSEGHLDFRADTVVGLLSFGGVISHGSRIRLDQPRQLRLRRWSREPLRLARNRTRPCYSDLNYSGETRAVRGARFSSRTRRISCCFFSARSRLK